MKTLVLIRHAKSSWKDPSLDDFDRPLNKRGKRDAPLMAKRLLDSGVRPDRILSSPARRAKKTALVVADVFELSSAAITFVDELYLASVPAWRETLRTLDTKTKTVFCFGHNPGITEFVNILCNEDIENIPTAGVALIQTEIENWADLSAGSGELVHFDYPKLHT